MGLAYETVILSPSESDADLGLLSLSPGRNVTFLESRTSETWSPNVRIFWLLPSTVSVTVWLRAP